MRLQVELQRCLSADCEHLRSEQLPIAAADSQGVDVVALHGFSDAGKNVIFLQVKLVCAEKQCRRNQRHRATFPYRESGTFEMEANQN